jgi:hypothetical protein
LGALKNSYKPWDLSVEERTGYAED